ncbi:MAG TPA: ABC transporter ATP-binding protein [Spirochaetota bacterium]|nr:ABC transporter ATP-binding protein [Spirochaetota bacterium]
MSQTVIKVENLYKQYQLGTIGYGTLRHDLQAWWSKVRGKDDPNAKVGAKRIKDLNETFMALQDVNFEIKEGEAVGIIGKNGAGKSTLLKILSRTTAPTKGQIKIRGKIASLLEVGTGFHPELTGRENIYLNGAILGMKKKEIAKKFDEIVAFSGIEQFIDTPVKRYSSGMYVRLAFAVAAHLDSDILILDEVLAVGDAEFQKKCLGKMDDVAKNQGRTVLFVSHNMAAVKSLCKKGILLSKGLLIEQGRVEKVLEKYMENFYSVTNNKTSQETDLSTIKRTQKEAFGLLFDKISFNKESYTPKDNFEIKIKLKTKIDKPYGDLFLGANIVDKTANDIYNFNNALINQIDISHKDDNVYSFSLDSLNLPEGRYFISLYLKANQEGQDFIENASYFDVKKPDAVIFNGHEVVYSGLVIPDYKFKITSQL